MSNHAESRRRPRRHHKSSSWMTGSLLIVGLSIAGVYCIWGDAPLEKTWIQLGFGKQPANSKIGGRQAAAQVPHVDVVEAMEFPGAVEEDPLPEFVDDTPAPKMANLDDNQESLPPNQTTGGKFLPGRSRQTATQANPNPFDNDSLTNPELDERFNPENLARNTASIRTAAFPGESQPEAASSDHSADTSSIPAESTPLPPRPRLVPPTEASKGIQLLAGDDAPPRQTPRQIGRRPARPNVPVSQTAANAGTGPVGLDLNAIQTMIDQGNDAEAYHLLSEAYFQRASQRPLFQKQLDEVAQRIYFSPQTQVQPPYEIQPGDQLRKIANKYQLSWQYLSRLNQVDAKKIRPGKKLKVFQGPFQARVDLSDFELTVLLNGQYVKRYPVGTGKMNTTPIGEFTVLEKLENPTYYGPDGMVLDADDPQNPLGERWIDIGNSFGIHGTIDPQSIGKSESAGCVRMRNEDVAEVYDLLTVGSSVRIQR